jgi:hypothetical protein
MSQPTIYSSNSVPFGIPGGAWTFLTNAGAAMSDGGIRVVDPSSAFKPKKEAVLIERQGISGNAGGFALAGSPTAGEPAEKQQKTTITIQVPTDASPAVGLGYYADVVYLGETARWVVYGATPSFQAGNAWVQELDIIRDHFAAEDVDPNNA